MSAIFADYLIAPDFKNIENINLNVKKNRYILII